MATRTHIADSINQLEENQRTLHKQQQQLQQIADLTEQAINGLTTATEENTKDIDNIYKRLDQALQDLDAITTNP